MWVFAVLYIVAALLTLALKVPQQAAACSDTATATVRS